MAKHPKEIEQSIIKMDLKYKNDFQIKLRISTVAPASRLDKYLEID